MSTSREALTQGLYHVSLEKLYGLQVSDTDHRPQSHVTADTALGVKFCIGPHAAGCVDS